jgi:SAM-dependent methyltransferase
VTRSAPPFRGPYAAIYDDLYRSKDYAGESSTVRAAVESWRPGAQTLLELGAGTGGHSEYLSRWYSLTSVERSRAMIRIAREKLAGRGVRFVQADLVRMRSFGGPFDACVSLFHVLNYLPRPAVPRLLQRIHDATSPGGVFVLDSWHESAVRRTGPSPRRSEWFRGGWRVTRTVVPRTDWRRRVCELDILIERSRGDGRVRRTRERHEMTFYGRPELVGRLASAGFLVRTVTNDAGDRLRATDWSMRVVATRLG